MVETAMEKFERIRREQNENLMEYANEDMKAVVDSDTCVFEHGELDAWVKGLIGLTTSTVLRCDDCIDYHLARLFELGISDDELIEALTCAMVIGGSIALPYIRRALKQWDELNRQEVSKLDIDLEYVRVERRILTILDNKNVDLEDRLQKVCQLLWKFFPHYDWVGFYMISKDGKTLELGPYTGAETEHVSIPMGKGICGQAAEKKETMIIQDVTKESNYLACSIAVQAEIVVPIIKDGKFIGVLDIDSHEREPFKDIDRSFLENISSKIAEII